MDNDSQLAGLISYVCPCCWPGSGGIEALVPKPKVISNSFSFFSGEASFGLSAAGGQKQIISRRAPKATASKEPGDQTSTAERRAS